MSLNIHKNTTMLILKLTDRKRGIINFCFFVVIKFCFYFNFCYEMAKSMQFDDADLVLVNPTDDTMDSVVVVERPVKKMKTQRE